MKIKFDIKYRPQIECGKYKVINHEGKPVTIERWDLKGNYPILITLPTIQTDYECEKRWVEDRPFVYSMEGICPDKAPSDRYYQLYIDTGDELTEAERILYNLVNDHVYNRESMDEDEVRAWMKENFLPTLIKDCKTNGDYFTMNHVEYVKLDNFKEN